MTGPSPPKPTDETIQQQPISTDQTFQAGNLIKSTKQFQKKKAINGKVNLTGPSPPKQNNGVKPQNIGQSETFKQSQERTDDKKEMARDVEKDKVN
jgi:hypothetical protein